MSTRVLSAGKIATVAMGVAMAAGLTAPTAFAGTNDCVSSNGVKGVEGCFYHKGDKFWLKDNEADGHSVYLEYEVEQGTSGRIDFTGGSGNSATYDFNFKEGQTVRYRVCVNEQFSGDPCSVWHDALA